MTARKKVLVRRFTPGVLCGYLPATGFVRRESAEPVLDLLDLDGRLQVLPLQQVRQVSFVRDFNVEDDINPERLIRRTFLARPRGEGLWVRLQLYNEEQIEGLASLDLSLADGFLNDLGLHFTPPDVRGNVQRMFVPRNAIRALEMLAVVSAPARRKPLETRIVAGGTDAAQLALELPEPDTQ